MNKTMIGQVKTEIDDKNIDIPIDKGRATLCEFLSTEDPADPKFDRLQQAIKARLHQHPDGRALLDRLESKIKRLNHE